MPDTGIDQRPYPEVMTASQFGDIIDRSRNWVYRHIADGSLPSRRAGNRIVLTRADLIKAGWLSQ